MRRDLFSLHFSPTICCIVGYVGACCVTLGRPPHCFDSAQHKLLSPDTLPVASVASLAATALSAASPFDWAQDRRRQSVRNAG
jgi:hypothetical protein